MEHLLFIAIVLALIEWRRFQQQKDYKAMEAQIEAGLFSLRVNAEKSRAEIGAQVDILRHELAPFNAFINQAQADLGMIVKEYELNGIPTHLRRGIPEQQFDAIEGL